MTTLTIVAKPEEGHKPDDKDDGNIAIDAIVQNIGDCKRASSVNEISKILTDYIDSDVDVIRIIGHGQPGVLGLGTYWNKTVFKPPHGQYYQLDSNPTGYGLLEKRLPRATPKKAKILKVWLIGCDVGNEVEYSVSDGPTLLFDLEQMWNSYRGKQGQCLVKVSAAPSVVQSRSFHNGVYTGSLITLNQPLKDYDELLAEGIAAPVEHREVVVDFEKFKADRWRGLQGIAPTVDEPWPEEEWLEDASEPAPPAAGYKQENVEQKVAVDFRKLIGGRPLGQYYSKQNIELTPDQADILKNAFDTRVELPPLLSLPEMEFELTWGDENTLVEAELILGGRYLRFRSPSGMIYLKAKKPREPQFRNALIALMDAARDRVLENK
ncbi:hypothetical protein [Pendulispora albinea]|uniref:Uncharacterized protein n=1 Tax=Pendulispora albinea TaxID=2741071 RepID=A0ABZ2LNC4_9BACT